MSKAKSRGLGRGLSALIGEAPKPVDAPDNAGQVVAQSSGAAARPSRLGIDKLRPGKFQPRQTFAEEDLESLSKSLKSKGILQPLLVRPRGDAYEIIAGERRWRAAQRAGLHDVPVIIEDLSDQDALEIGIIENVQRADLNPMEEAQALQRLMDEFSYTQDAMAKTIGKSRSHIANMLRLNNLPDAVRALVMQNKLSAGHARALVGRDDALALATKVVEEGLSVRALEKLIASTRRPSTKNTQQASGEKDADTRALEKTLSDDLGLKVDIQDQAGAGRLTIQYKSLEQLDEVIRRLLRG
jgi:ParB family chromosome partitioning protein